ncbi:MAG: Glu/Leu/Phe/Val dehydrogenase [Chloroflexi bacterium]|nr:Glu/Leu/Phe/Val dehydrogenase [Chloroflexota bacterium]
MKVMDYMAQHGHEQLVYCSNPEAGLRAFIAIHDTTLGPALGGARMRPYASEAEAVEDVLRLARAMTYKAAVAGLNLGGGKAAIIGDPHKDKTEALFKALGRFIHSLGGRYITTEDVGTTEREMQYIRPETPYVTGLPVSWGGSGDPSPATSFGIYRGMKACAHEVYGSDSLAGKTVALQGVGKVGYGLAKYLHEEGAKLVVTDIYPEAAQRVHEELGATLVEPEAIYDVDCHIFSPCAFGAVLNARTIPRFRCQIVAGAANNQLETDEDGQELHHRGILYAPDYVLNGGGLINISYEVGRAYSHDAAWEQVTRIYDTIGQIIALAKADGICTAQAADRMAEARIAAARKVKNLYLG